MAKKLYVGNLSYQVDSSELQEMFAAFGNADRDQALGRGIGELATPRLAPPGAKQGRINVVARRN